MATVNKLYAQLQKLIEEGHGDLEVFAANGGSGEYDQTGGAHLATGDPNYDGEEIEFVALYIGN